MYPSSFAVSGGSHSSSVAILSMMLLHKKCNHACYKDLTNDGGDLKRVLFHECVFHSKSVLYILRGVLEGYTCIIIFSAMAEFYSVLFTMGLQ